MQQHKEKKYGSKLLHGRAGDLLPIVASARSLKCEILILQFVADVLAGEDILSEK